MYDVYIENNIEKFPIRESVSGYKSEVDYNYNLMMVEKLLSGIS